MNRRTLISDLKCTLCFRNEADDHAPVKFRYSPRAIAENAPVRRQEEEDDAEDDEAADDEADDSSDDDDDDDEGEGEEGEDSDSDSDSDDENEVNRINVIVVETKV